MEQNVIIINIGGTFNKIYNPLNGELEIPKNNDTINCILEQVTKKKASIKLDGIIFKDSLAMDKNDRKSLLNKIQSSEEVKIIIIHGTDTMKKSAKILSKFIKNKIIVFVGAMKPYSIEPVEASATLFMALGFLNHETNETQNHGVYICMNGLIKKHDKIRKNYAKGVFECL